MQLETLQQLKALGFFEWMNEITKNSCEIPSDEELQEMADDEFTSLGLSGFIYKFFRDEHSLLGNPYSKSIGYTFEARDAVGGTVRLPNILEVGDLASGTFTTFELAEEALFLEMIKYVKK